jgi:hypothetical protein
MLIGQFRQSGDVSQERTVETGQPIHFERRGHQNFVTLQGLQEVTPL